MTPCNLSDLNWAAVFMFIVSVCLFSPNEIMPNMRDQRRKAASVHQDLIDEIAIHGRNGGPKLFIEYFSEIRPFPGGIIIAEET